MTRVFSSWNFGPRRARARRALQKGPCFPSICVLCMWKEPSRHTIQLSSVRRVSARTCGLFCAFQFLFSTSENGHRAASWREHNYLFARFTAWFSCLVSSAEGWAREWTEKKTTKTKKAVCMVGMIIDINYFMVNTRAGIQPYKFKSHITNNINRCTQGKTVSTRNHALVFIKTAISLCYTLQYVWTSNTCMFYRAGNQKRNRIIDFSKFIHLSHNTENCMRPHLIN